VAIRFELSNAEFASIRGAITSIAKSFPEPGTYPASLEKASVHLLRRGQRKQNLRIVKITLG